MDVIITVVGGCIACIIYKVAEGDQDVVCTTVLITVAEEEEALDEHGDDDDNFSEGTKYKY